MRLGKAAVSEAVGNSAVLSGKNSKYAFPILSFILFFACAFQLYYHAVRTSATVDEGAHILAGYRHLQCGDFGINPEHPPLLKMIAAVPLAFRNWDEPPWECGSRLTPKPEMFGAGTSFLVENGVDSVLIPARLAAASSAMLLAVLVFLAAREMFGRAEAFVALAIIAFEPSLIALGSLVLTDMILAAAAFGAVYALYRYRKNPNGLRFLAVGLAFGLLLAAKHSAVLFVPILFVVLTADAVLFRDSETRLPRSFLRSTLTFAAFGLVGWAILWSFYGFRYNSIPSASTGTLSVADYIKENGRPEMVRSLPAKTVDRINRTRLFPESYVLGMADVVAWGSRNSFLFGVKLSDRQMVLFPHRFRRQNERRAASAAAARTAAPVLRKRKASRNAFFCSCRPVCSSASR